MKRILSISVALLISCGGSEERTRICTASCPVPQAPTPDITPLGMLYLQSDEAAFHYGPVDLDNAILALTAQPVVDYDDRDRPFVAVRFSTLQEFGLPSFHIYGPNDLNYPCVFAGGRSGCLIAVDDHIEIAIKNPASDCDTAIGNLARLVSAYALLATGYDVAPPFPTFPTELAYIDAHLLIATECYGATGVIPIQTW